MKKKLFATTMSAVLALSLSACGDEGDDVDDEGVGDTTETTLDLTDTTMAEDMTDTTMAEDTETTMTDTTG